MLVQNLNRDVDACIYNTLDDRIDIFIDKIIQAFLFPFYKMWNYLIKN